jgi:MFS family permease
VVTGDVGQVALVLAAEAVPRVLLLPVGGALADRINPRLVMLLSNISRAAVVATLGVTLLSGLPSFWLVIVFAALQGASSGLYLPGSQAILPWTVRNAEIPAANGLMQIILWLTMVIGPVLGGIAVAGQVATAFLADAASFLVSAFTLAGIRLTPPDTPAARAASNSGAIAPDGEAQTAANASQEPEPVTAAPSQELNTQELKTNEPRKRASIFSEMGAGMAYAFGQPLMRSALMVTILGNLAYIGTFGVALILLSRRLDPSPLTLGLLLSACGIGGVLGGLAAGPVGRLRHRGLLTLLLWSIMPLALFLTPIYAGTAASLPFPLDLTVVNFGEVTIGDVQLGILNYGDQLAGLTTDERLLAIAILLGLTTGVIALGETVFITVLQQRIPPHLMARVFSVQFIAAGVAEPISLVAAGLLTATLGAGVAFFAAAALFFIAALIGLSSRTLRRA